MNDFEKVNIYRGFKYAIHLNDLRGYRCGYVEIKEDHPLYEVKFNEIDIDCISLSYNGRLKIISGYFIGWDHNHIWDGVDKEAIRQYHPDNAEDLIYEAISLKDVCRGSRATLEDVEKECFNVIDELYRKYESKSNKKNKSK